MVNLSKNRIKTEQPMKELHHNNKIQKIVLMAKHGASVFFVFIKLLSQTALRI